MAKVATIFNLNLQEVCYRGRSSLRPRRGHDLLPSSRHGHCGPLVQEEDLGLVREEGHVDGGDGGKKGGLMHTSYTQRHLYVHFRLLKEFSQRAASFPTNERNPSSSNDSSSNSNSPNSSIRTKNSLSSPTMILAVPHFTGSTIRARIANANLTSKFYKCASIRPAAFFWRQSQGC